MYPVIAGLKSRICKALYWVITRIKLAYLLREYRVISRLRTTISSTEYRVITRYFETTMYQVISRQNGKQRNCPWSHLACCNVSSNLPIKWCTKEFPLQTLHAGICAYRRLSGEHLRQGGEMPIHEFIRNSSINEVENTVQTSCNVPCVLVEDETFLCLILLVSGDHLIGPIFTNLVVSKCFFLCSSLKSLIGRSPDMVFMHYR